MTNKANETNRWRIIVVSMLLALVCLYGAWVRIPYLSVPVVMVDEALYAEIANIILDGGVAYRDGWEQKPPGIYYLYACVFYLFGHNNLYAVRVTAVFAVLLTCIGLFYIAKYLYDDTAGLVAALVYAILASAGAASHFQAANTEVFAIPWMVWGLYFFLRYYRRPALVVLSGCLISIAALFKQPACLIVVVCFARLIPDTLPPTKRWKRQRVMHLICFFVGIFIPITAVLIYFWMNNALYDLFLVGFWHNILYMKGNDLSQSVLAARKNIPYFIHTTWPMYLFAGVVWIVRTGPMVYSIINKKNIDFRHLFVFMLFPAGWIAVGLGGRFEGHYFYFVLPAISILCADMVSSIVCCIRTKILQTQLRVFAYSVLALVCAAVLLHTILYEFGFPVPRKKYYTMLDPQNPRSKMFLQAAQYIQNHTASDDKIFVWGFCPQLYTLSNRRSASRFVFCNFLVGQMTGDKDYFAGVERIDRTIPGAWTMLMTDLENNKPAYIIDTAQTDYYKYGSYPAGRFYLLKYFLDRYYQVDTTINGMLLYKLRDEVSDSL